MIKKVIVVHSGKPCSHKGCLNHTTHPCEGCGRTAGRGVIIGSLFTLKDMVKNNTKSVYVVAMCDDCNWTGKPSDCETYIDQDGWENPEYEVAICPLCNEHGVIYLTQKEMDSYKDV